MKFKFVKCSDCGATHIVERDREFVFCFGCGAGTFVESSGIIPGKLSTLIYIINDYTEESVSFDFDKCESVFVDSEENDDDQKYCEDDFDDEDDFV